VAAPAASSPPPAGSARPHDGGAITGGESVVVAEPQATEASGQPDTAAPAWRRLRRTLRVEVAVLGLVVAVTATLVGIRPAAEAAGVTEPFSTAVPIGGDAQLSMTIDPNQVGHNAIHLYVLDATGRPVDATGVELRMSLPANDIGPLVRTPTFIAPGHWVHTGNDLVASGRWHIETLVTIDRFEQRRATVTVDVRS
jgi:copper transport protein